MTDAPGPRAGGAAEPRGTLGTVRNAVLLLDLLTDGPAFQQLTDLADRSGLSIPTVHRLLRSLVLADLVQQDPRSARYSLGPGVARLSQRYLGRLPILGALAPYLVSLRDTLQATVHVSMLVRDSIVYVDRVDAGDGGQYRDSHRVAPALSTASGRMLAARADDDVWEQCVAGQPEEIDGDPRALREEWAAAAHLVTGGRSTVTPREVAVVMLDSAGRPVAALAATLDAEADGQRAATTAQLLTRTAIAAGRTLGHG